MMNRVALRPVILPDGTCLGKGENSVVDITNMSDPAIYPNPEAFDGYRFSRMRNTPGQEQQAHLVSTSPSHLGFGHGVHACPGRFFAANEAKVILAKLLIEFDFKTDPDYTHFWEEHGFGMGVRSDARLWLKKKRSM